MHESPYKGNKGITRVLQAAKNSWSGLLFAIKEESAFRQEMLLVLISFLLMIFIETSLLEKCIMIFSTIFVLVVELLNSSLETTIDRISYEYHDLSKKAKDYGSAAVMLSLIFWILTHVIIFLY